ncbi:MAG TPA: hypothetical protein VHW60_19550 [Caulobacteraceae bacterium]|jgi:hypothetical protein|nr:hypothetical protein [Caulobacteraceae bacterium]
MTGFRGLLSGVALASLALPSFAAPPSLAAMLGTPGKAQCFNPDLAHKTCTSLVSYAADAKGALHATTLSIQDGPTNMQSVLPVTIRGEAACTTLTAASIEAATFFVAGVPADAARTSQLRAEAESGAEDAIGHQTCNAFVAKGASFAVQASVDGKRTPDGDQTMIWVAPGDGYRVAP